MAHDEIIDHYSALARAADAGRTVADCRQDAFVQGGFGAAGYDDLTVLPEGAVRASLGCGNPVAVADLRHGETVLDLGSGGGIDVLLSARRVGPSGTVYGRTSGTSGRGSGLSSASAARPGRSPYGSTGTCWPLPASSRSPSR
ncbi:hypothetical protein [Nonomuraea sp. KM88]|uniref:hypothetical protein n=1 Tax=Nonomuraea sp. KM88 TaxID=3457427 RepID=UPI003FCDBAEC